MPNSGSGDPTDPLRPVGPSRSDALTPSDITTGPHQADAVTGPSAASGAIATEGVGGSEPTSTEAIASALSTGALDVEAARAQLIDQAIQAQLPPDATPETIAAVRAEVEALVGSDPVLEQLLRP